MKEEVMRRFLRYVQVDTQSDETSEACPSTAGQWTLARMLAEELETLGMKEVTIDDHGYVMATLPANTDKPVPTIGFLAHMDTSPDLTGAGVNPQIVERYDGGAIVLNAGQNITLSPDDFPELSNYIGQTLITTDGSTLLGADDKAGIAEIMTAMAYLIAHPEIKHGKVRVAFTPDEEIGRGAHRFDVQAFGAKFAYTMDGGPLGELQYESFNAASAFVVFTGKSVHPGTAKGKMINSAKLAMAFHARVPEEQSPEHTEGYEGYFHLVSFEGSVEETKLHYLIRDFDKDGFARRKERLAAIVKDLQAEYGDERITIAFKDRYFNMREKIEPVMEIVDIARRAMDSLGIKPIIEPIRGGTDGSQLSYMGLPTPNLFAGGENFHGRYEYVSADTMARAAEVIVAIIRLFEAGAAAAGNE